jgi:hypothetical protein
MITIPVQYLAYIGTEELCIHRQTKLCSCNKIYSVKFEVESCNYVRFDVHCALTLTVQASSLLVCHNFLSPIILATSFDMKQSFCILKIQQSEKFCKCVKSDTI